MASATPSRSTPCSASTSNRPRPPRSRRRTARLELCIYDSQHILVGDWNKLDTFLTELDDRGNPPFSTVAADKPMYRSIDFQLKNKLIQVRTNQAIPRPSFSPRSTYPDSST